MSRKKSQTAAQTITDDSNLYDESDNENDSPIKAETTSKNNRRRSKRTNKQKSTPTEAPTAIGENATSKKNQKKNTKTPVLKDNSIHNSTQEIRHQIKELKPHIMACFQYDLKEVDFFYLQDFFEDLMPKLKEIWNRIGFNKEAQSIRIDKLYENLIETFHGIIESEEDLEQKILDSIEEQRLLINELCLELSIKPSELKLKKARSVLEEDEILRIELKNLQSEKKKRMDEYNKLVNKENELCQKLALEPTERRLTVPSEQQLSYLSNRIKELSDLRDQRTQEMLKLKQEIVELTEDLEVSRSDSFIEMIVMESADVMPLGEADLKRSKEYRDELKQKNVSIVNEIRTLRVKIREL